MPRKKQTKEYELRRAVGKIPQHDIGIIPLPFSPFYDVMNQVIDRLSEVPVFVKDGNNLIIRDPEKSRARFQAVKVEHKAVLLGELASILISHYKNIQIDSEKINSERRIAFVEALDELASWKEELISSGVFNERNFKKTLKKFVLGITKYLKEVLYEGFSTDQRTQLVKDLDACFFKFVSKLRTKKNARFHCIAYILKGFNLEEGTEEKIFGRIKVDFYRKIGTSSFIP